MIHEFFIPRRFLNLAAMVELRQSLFVLTQNTTLRKDSGSVVLCANQSPKTRIPLIALDAIFCFGRVRCTQQLLAICVTRGIAVNFLTQHGRFLASVQGYNHGNIAIRREQFRKADCPEACLGIARYIVEGKISNYRSLLRRAARERCSPEASNKLERTADQLDLIQKSLQSYTSVDAIRGIEGHATQLYFGAFNAMLNSSDSALQFTQRSRRPPLDPINSLLSFGYTLLAADMRSACEAAGLDARVGYLHKLRSGRPSLALDLMEDFRPLIVDRLVLSLVNRRQISDADFTRTENQGVQMNDRVRRVFIAAYQKKKLSRIAHPLTQETVSLSQCMIMQAKFLAKHLSEKMPYTPFITR
jgi:CRISPR-associated protein Cas1